MIAPGVQWVEDKDAAKHPVTHRIVPQAKSYLAQKISSNEAEKISVRKTGVLLPLLSYSFSCSFSPFNYCQPWRFPVLWCQWWDEGLLQGIRQILEAGSEYGIQLSFPPGDGPSLSTLRGGFALSRKTNIFLSFILFKKILF